MGMLVTAMQYSLVLTSRVSLVVYVVPTPMEKHAVSALLHVLKSMSQFVGVTLKPMLTLAYWQLLAARLSGTSIEDIMGSVWQCGATSCAGLKNAGIAKIDGIYSLYPNSSCNMPVQVYCHDMNTASPKEYITLAAGAEENYAYIYPQRQQRRPYSARYQCNGPPRKMNYSAAGLTKFNKVRLEVNDMRIVRDDFTFAVSDPFGKKIPFGSAGDCFSMHYGPCRRGHFKVSDTVNHHHQ
ncbi:hypothetical protein QZH41_012971 [Actinostola sp. cb2023]|nr:hypothetical protein QZH41_012971 [Actinostola sp. cb2023]